MSTGGWYVDATSLALGRALYAARRRKHDDIWYPGGPGSPIKRASMPDPDWLPIVGGADYAVFTCDKRIERRPAEKAAVIQHAVQLFALRGAGSKDAWHQVRLVARWWPDMVAKREALPGPFIVGVTWNGLRQIYPPPP